MATFTTLSPQDVTDILAAYGLTYVSHRPIAAGTINTNVFVETNAGPRFLRINEGKARPDVEREAAIVAHVAAAGVPTPPPVPTRAGDAFAVWKGAFVSLFPWVPGRVLSRAEVTPAHAAAVGGALARLHLAGADVQDRGRSRYEPDEIEARLARVCQLGDAQIDAAAGVLGPALARLREVRAVPLPEGVIHGDLFIDNVLFTDDGALSALLDFEQAAWGRLAYDVAVTVLAFGYGREDFRPDVTEALLAGYRAVRPPQPVETAGFPDELRFAACRFAVTRITDVYLRARDGAPAGKDFRRYLQRLASVEAHAQRETSWLRL